MEIKSQLIDAQLEMVVNDDALPANGKPGRVVFVLSSGTVLVDDGAVWKRLSGGSLGDVRQSTLKPQEFYTENGNTWVLADGRNVTDSDWANLTFKTHVPDYRGVFLRSINDDPDPTQGKEPPRADGLQNPDGQKDVDEYTDDKTNQNNLTIGSYTHSHKIFIRDNGIFTDEEIIGTTTTNRSTLAFASGTILAGNDVATRRGSYRLPSGGGTVPPFDPYLIDQDTHSHNWLTSDNETAPKHGHVYTYIKINR